MRDVHVPFATGSRCALIGWREPVPFHSCAPTPDFGEENRLALFTREDIDRWRGGLTRSLQRAVGIANTRVVARATAWVGRRSAQPGAAPAV